MHSMLSGFYDYIANRINTFFQTQAAGGLLQSAESFCLKLDDDDMVDHVYSSLHKLADSKGIRGFYSLRCMDGSFYRTFSLIVKGTEVIIAAQSNGMTNDFLGATLRNAANESGKPLLMITAHPIDSALSGSRDMSAKGMPFYPDNLIADIKNLIDTSTMLSKVEKRILQFELYRNEKDVFSDKSSLYEYRELLAIMESGKIEDDMFPGFRLFSIDGKKDFTTYGDNQIDKEIRKDNDFFERIDRSIRFGNLDNDLSADFDDGFIRRLTAEKNKNLDQWSRLITYQQVLRAYAKKQEQKNKPLQIEKEDIFAYRDIELNQYKDDDELFIRNEGSQKARKRTKSILIFNPDNYETVHVKIVCNIKLPNQGIKCDVVKFERDHNDLIFPFEKEDLGFHRIKLEDLTNKITYVLKVCILGISPKYLIPTIKTSFVIDYKDNKKKCKIRILGMRTDLSFNQGGDLSQTEKLEDNKTYDCDYQTRLNIYSSEEELSNFGNGINIDVNFAGVVVPFVLYPDEAKSVEITGRRILRDKFADESSFVLSGDGQIQRDAQEYFVKGQLQKEISLENNIIKGKILSGSIAGFRNDNGTFIRKDDFNISKDLLQAYTDLLETYETKQTTPTLAFIGDKEIEDSARRYLSAFMDEFSSLTGKVPLNEEQQNALLIGTLTVGPDMDEILLTPFHPLNIAYQLSLLNEKGFELAPDVIVERLSSIYLLPFIQRRKRVYRVSDQLYSMEWKHYAPVENKKYMGGRKYVSKLVEDKVDEFVGHFRYIFDDINNRSIRLNLINMGDCSEILQGIAQYYCHVIKKSPDIDKLLQFHICVYTNNFMDNAFNYLKNRNELKAFLDGHRLSLDPGTAMSDLEDILAKNVFCYFKEDKGDNYSYSHITFYEMESEITSEVAMMDQIATGVSLGGILSGVPSSRYGQKYRTGFGSKYAKSTDLEKVAELLNSLSQVGDSGNPYQAGVGISTQIDESAEKKMKFVYSSSNWVVFVDPKVDLDFFCEKEAHNDLLIIHYSDQYTSSSGYDAITVTHKSKQYSNVIKEYLQEKGLQANQDDISNVINLFNAINGDWLLRLVSSKRVIGINKDSTFSREKISIVAAIKLMLAYLKHPDILWVPISMEEMLRVSGGAGLSQSEGILSAKNLGFEKGPTSDDLLFVGIHEDQGKLNVYFYPTEVKTGNNDSSVISKAFEQVSTTARGLENALNPSEADPTSISYKVNRNFMMQLVINSCKKMKVYHVDDTQNWDLVLDRYREQLLNEEYIISNNIREVIGNGAVLSFKKGAAEQRSSFKEDVINLIEMPETDEYSLILKSVQDIAVLLDSRESEMVLLSRLNVSGLTGSTEHLQTTPYLNNEHNVQEEQNPDPKESEAEYVKKDEPGSQNDDTEQVAEADVLKNGMKIVFGTNLLDGKSVIWEPNDTDRVFHTNTGIIGTMGTGKTQFTKSLITQLYHEQKNNVNGLPLGILIFDYKGDYNASKADFVQAVNASVFQPFHLPFNPLALTKSNVQKPLLPIHAANSFKDTLSKVYGLGAKQQDTLFRCILDAYHRRGIQEDDPGSWNIPAPTFETVYSIYANDEDIKKTDSLAAAMNKLHQFQVFEAVSDKTKSLFDLLNGVVVIDLSGYDPDIQSLVIAITLDLFYSQMQAAGSSKLEGKYRQLTKLVLVDEADNFMSQGFPSLKKILKEGREFGVGTILSTQFLKHFGSGDDDYSKYILTWVVHNVADLKPSDVDFVFNTEPKGIEEQKLFNDIKQLKKHHSIVKIGTGSPQYIEDLPFWKLMAKS